MLSRWYYSHGGITHGPFSMEQIKEHAAQKMLLESNLLWQGGHERNAVLARTVLDFAKLTLAASVNLAWLDDVAKVESKGPLPGPVAGKDGPDWLQDLRLWYGLEVYAAAKPSQVTAPNALQAGGTPDWLESWLAPEKAPASKQPATPSSAPTVKPGAKRKAPRSPEPTRKTKHTTRFEHTVIEKVVDETGFDPTTGQILDPEKFGKWQRLSRSRQSEVTNESLFEAFRKARTAIENWVDDDNHQPLVLAGDLSAIKKEESLLAVFQRFQGFGPEMQEKLTSHLEFMVENRRKYYAARSNSV